MILGWGIVTTLQYKINTVAVAHQPTINDRALIAGVLAVVGFLINLASFIIVFFIYHIPIKESFTASLLLFPASFILSFLAFLFGNIELHRRNTSHLGEQGWAFLAIYLGGFSLLQYLVLLGVFIGSSL